MPIFWPYWNIGVFAIPNMPDEKKRELYAAYSEAGYKIKVFDYPMMQTAGKKRYLRELDIEELLTLKRLNDHR